MQAADNDFLMSLTFAPPLKRRITLVNYEIESLRGATGNHGMDVLILDLCVGILCEWGELSAPWFAYSVKVRSAANSGWAARSNPISDVLRELRKCLEPLQD